MKRPFLIAYGLLAYASFNASFLYLAGFLQAVAVPKAINDGIETSTAAALAINLTLVFLFGFFHSLMAREGFKKHWTRIIPVDAERSTYVLQSALFLALAMWQWRPMTQTVWEVEGPLAMVLVGIFFAGIAVLLISTFLIDHFELFGVKQVWLANAGTPLPPATFRTPMLYRFVRHPMQLGVLITVFATPHMTVGHLVFAASMAAYVLVGLHFEERSLVREFGTAYRSYQRTTPMLLPRLIPARRSRAPTRPQPATVRRGKES
ncbi:MAG: methanethiol S-methyltransferase [Pseudomonadota bacterium]